MHLVNQYKHLFEIDNVELTFRDEALIEIAKTSHKKKNWSKRFAIYYGRHSYGNYVWTS